MPFITLISTNVQSFNIIFLIIFEMTLDMKRKLQSIFKGRTVIHKLRLILSETLTTIEINIAN